MTLPFGMILFFQDRGRLAGVTIFYFLFTVTSKFGGKAIFLSFFKWRSKFSGSFPRSSSMEKPPSGKTKNIAQGLLSKEEEYTSV